MLMRPSTAVAAAALLAGHVAAKTDIAGCVSSQTVAYGGASLIWYVPGTGEICEFLDCGGGRAPPKTTVPGCVGYEGTATYSPRYLSGFGYGFGAATSTASSSASEAVTTEASSSGSTSASALASASTSQDASITSPPVTTLTGTVTSQAGSDSTAAPSSSGSSSGGFSSGGSTDQSTSSVSTGAAALPTAAVRGGLGVIAGLAAGVAML